MWRERISDKQTFRRVFRTIATTGPLGAGVRLTQEVPDCTADGAGRKRQWDSLPPLQSRKPMPGDVALITTHIYSHSFLLASIAQ